MSLPEICHKCRQLRSKDLGRFFTVHGRCHDRKFICNRCLSKPQPARAGNSEPSPIEKEARQAIIETGWKFVEEFEFKSFRFDFAIIALRLFIEVDSKRWHQHPSRRARDRRKEEAAKAEGWDVARVTTRSADSIPFMVKQVVMTREAELATTPDY
jgi:very-short-patch-repair endonuclease